MYNVVRNSELRACGLNSRTIKAARDCCLIKLSHGIYSITARCGKPEHGRIASLVTDERWLEQVGKRSEASPTERFQFDNTIAKLRISSYPRYFGDDVVCGISAAYIHDLPMYRVSDRHIQIANPVRRMHTSIVSRTARFIAPEDTVSVGKLVVTSPVRTGFDLIETLGEAAAFAALETVLRRATFGSVESANRMSRAGYPTGTNELAREQIESEFRPVLKRLPKNQRRAGRLLDAIGPLSESYAESRCSYNLAMLGITSFEQQVQVLDGFELVARVDFMDRAAKTILLVDGAAKYVENGHPLLQKEATQYNRLIALGYRVVRFTFPELLNLEDFATKLYGQAPWLRDSARAERAG